MKVYWTVQVPPGPFALSIAHIEAKFENIELAKSISYDDTNEFVVQVHSAMRISILLGPSPTLKRHFELQIKILQKAHRRDADKSRQANSLHLSKIAI